MTGTDFFFVDNLKSQELNLDNYFTRKLCGRDLPLLRAFCQDLGLQVAPTGRRKPVLIIQSKKTANNFFDADHHFEPHKIRF